MNLLHPPTLHICITRPLPAHHITRNLPLHEFLDWHHLMHLLVTSHEEWVLVLLGQQQVNGFGRVVLVEFVVLETVVTES